MELRRLRVDQTGSLAAPAELQTLFDRNAHGEVSDAAFARAEQDFAAAGPPVAQRSAVAERIRLVRNVPLEEYRTAVPFATVPVKETLVSADRISQRFAHELSTHVYANMDAFMADVIAIEREMIAQLIAAGCRYIQIDAPGYTAYGDDVSLERMRSRVEDSLENLDRAIRADNAIIAGFENVCFGIHLCRGNVRTLDPKTGQVKSSFPNFTTTAFCSSTTPNAPADSSRCVSFRATRSPCWFSYQPKRRRSRAPNSSSAVSTTRAGTFRSSSWRSVHSAASAASERGSSFRKTSSGKSSSAFWKSPLASGMAGAPELDAVGSVEDAA